MASMRFTAVIAGACWSALLAGPVAFQEPQVRATGVQDALDSLRAKSPEDKVLAEYFAEYRRGAGRLESGQITGIGPIEPVPPPPGAPIEHPLAGLKRAVCAADVVVQGSAAVSRTILNTGDTFFVTVFDITVTRQLRPVGGPLHGLSIALAGGEGVINGRKTVARPPIMLRVNTSVVLFLRRLEKTPTYVLSRQVGLVSFSQDVARPEMPVDIEYFRDRVSEANFLTDVGNVQSSCEK